MLACCNFSDDNAATTAAAAILTACHLALYWPTSKITALIIAIIPNKYCCIIPPYHMGLPGTEPSYGPSALPQMIQPRSSVLVELTLGFQGRNSKILLKLIVAKHLPTRRLVSL